jgi:hypothetical protein
MFFGYPVSATQSNWLHECVCAAVRAIHALVDEDRRYPPWPQILPEDRQSALRRRYGFDERLREYDAALRLLAKAERDYVLEALEAQNRISGLLSGTAHDCARKDDLPQGVRGAIARLFDYAFDILGEETINLRAPHYTTIYSDLPVPVCPFCALHGFSDPEAPQEALDHYLNRDIYPFAAANLRNLVPMCHDCNSKYKKTADIIQRADVDRTRRVAFDPYDFATKVSVSVDGSSPFVLGPEHAQAWVIQLDPDIEQVRTWDDVFSVRERYGRDHLKHVYGRWVEYFAEFARKKMGSYSQEQLIDLLCTHEEDWKAQGFEDRAFLKAAVFRMLRVHCEAGHQEALDHLREWIYPPSDEAMAAEPEFLAEGDPAAVVAEDAQLVAIAPPPAVQAPHIVLAAAPQRVTAPPLVPAVAFLKAEAPSADPPERKNGPLDD